MNAVSGTGSSVIASPINMRSRITFDSNCRLPLHLGLASRYSAGYSTPRSEGNSGPRSDQVGRSTVSPLPLRRYRPELRDVSTDEAEDGDTEEDESEHHGQRRMVKGPGDPGKEDHSTGTFLWIYRTPVILRLVLEEPESGEPSTTGRAARGELLARCGLDASVGWSG